MRSPDRGPFAGVSVALATRAVGVEALFAGLPLPALVVFGAVTQLGDVWFYFLTLASAYWFGDTVAGSDRRHAAFLLGCALTALALTTTLKGFFSFPRPPGAGVAEGADRLSGVLRALYTNAATADGTGFPSGHALGVALVWGGAALTLDADRRTRLVAGGLVVLLVGVSRVALGVHYAVDVLAGWAVGGAALALLLSIDADRKPGRAFSLAAVAAVVGAVNSFDATHLTALGAALGARITWGAVGTDALAADPGLRSGAALTVVGIPTLGGPFFYLYLVEPAAPVAFAASALITGGVLVLPILGELVK
ncbi:MAG: phosphatase PAP2 family protein [Haloglomus sp.]